MIMIIFKVQMIFVRLVPVITINFTGLASTHILEKVTTVGGTMRFSITNVDLDGCEREAGSS